MKKNCTLLFVLVLMGIVSHAQFTKGQMVLGGNFGFYLKKLEQKPPQNYDTKSFSLVAKPYFGWFVKKNQLVGLSIDFARNVDTLEFSINYFGNQNVIQSAGATIFTQRFFTIVPRLYFTLKGSAGAGYLFGRTTNTTQQVYTVRKQKGFDAKLALSPGLSYRVSQRFLFDLSLNDLAFAAFNQSEYSTNSPVVTLSKAMEQNFSVASSLNTNLNNVGLGFRWLMH